MNITGVTLCFSEAHPASDLQPGRGGAAGQDRASLLGRGGQALLHHGGWGAHALYRLEEEQHPPPCRWAGGGQRQRAGEEHRGDQ